MCTFWWTNRTKYSHRDHNTLSKCLQMMPSPECTGTHDWRLFWATLCDVTDFKSENSHNNFCHSKIEPQKELSDRISALGYQYFEKNPSEEMLNAFIECDVTFRSIASCFQAIKFHSPNCFVKTMVQVIVWLIAVIVASDWCSEYISYAGYVY